MTSTLFREALTIQERQYPYCRIQVRNFRIFYVVIGDAMEVQQILYSRRNWKRKI